MDEEQYKQIMFINYEGFSRIIWNLQAEIVFLWTNGQLEMAYERIKQLFIHVSAHLTNKKIKEGDKEKDFEDYFMKKFNDIEKVIYNPANKKFGKYAEYKKQASRKEADKLMTDVYIEIKRKMKESGLEAFYGTPKDIKIGIKRDKNMEKIFGEMNYSQNDKP